MNWTEPKPPTEGISYYDHTIVETPLGTARIEWKSWKECPSYDIEIENIWVGCEYSLDEAKNATKEYLQKKLDELTIFLYQ